MCAFLRPDLLAGRPSSKGSADAESNGSDGELCDERWGFHTPPINCVVAVDPGPTASGVVVLNELKKVMYCAVLSNDELHKYLRSASYCVVVFERIASYGMAVGDSVFETCVWTGRFAEVAIQRTHVQVFRIPRKDVKVFLCGSMRAKDKNVAQALRDKLGEVGTKKRPGPLYGISSHMWSALAVAITFIETEDRSKWEY